MARQTVKTTTTTTTTVKFKKKVEPCKACGRYGNGKKPKQKPKQKGA